MGTTPNRSLRHTRTAEHLVDQVNARLDDLDRLTSEPVTVSLSGKSSPYAMTADVDLRIRGLLIFTSASGAMTVEFPTTVTISGESAVTLRGQWCLVNDSSQTLTFKVTGGSLSVVLPTGQTQYVRSTGAELRATTAAFTH